MGEMLMEDEIDGRKKTEEYLVLPLLTVFCPMACL
jgi:hypothetical protein